MEDVENGRGVPENPPSGPAALAPRAAPALAAQQGPTPPAQASKRGVHLPAGLLGRQKKQHAMREMAAHALEGDRANTVSMGGDWAHGWVEVQNARESTTCRALGDIIRNQGTMIIRVPWSGRLEIGAPLVDRCTTVPDTAAAPGRTLRALADSPPF